jgi:hypothetical protein
LKLALARFPPQARSRSSASLASLAVVVAERPTELSTRWVI